MSRLGGSGGYLGSGAQFARACYAQPLATLLSLLKSALVGGAVLGLIQPAFAIGAISNDQPIFPTSGQGIYAALLDLDGANAKSAPAQRGDDAFSALAGFAQTVATVSKRSGQKAAASAQADDAIYSELAEFAQRVSAKQALSPEPRLKLADADNAVDALKDFLRMAAADVPKTVVGKKPSNAATKTVVKGGSGDAYVVGSDKCATCHATQVAEFNKTLMGRINKTTRKGQFECENCHGPGSAHVAAGGGRGVGGINGFNPQTPQEVEQNNGICLACHEKGSRTAWHGSTHEERGIACTNCHSVMRNVTLKSNLVKPTTQQVCFQCHKLQQAQMQRSSHMPVREGKITCTDCHNAHGSKYGTEAMLDAPSINDNCYKCHAEKRGPMLWEHAPVRENCLNCHEAHGSNHEFLLKVSRPRLCAECHAFAHGGQAGFGAGSTNFTVGHSCNNCHTQIHGSNHPSGAFFQR
jgi:DmsE family decaheme c-type cytochrome